MEVVRASLFLKSWPSIGEFSLRRCKVFVGFYFEKHICAIMFGDFTVITQNKSYCKVTVSSFCLTYSTLTCYIIKSGWRPSTCIYVWTTIITDHVQMLVSSQKNNYYNNQPQLLTSTLKQCVMRELTFLNKKAPEGSVWGYILRPETKNTTCTTDRLRMDGAITNPFQR